jgi:hypothetical protein
MGLRHRSVREHTIMKIFRIVSLMALIAVGLASTAQAQTFAGTTTLSAAMTSTQTTMVVASATGFAAGKYVYIDAEVVQIASSYSGSGTTIPIQRGQNGTAAAAHATSERVIVGVGMHFQQSNPFYGAACTPGQAQAAYLPWINVPDGLVWMCVSNAWRATSTSIITYNSIPTSFP